MASIVHQALSPGPAPAPNLGPLSIPAAAANNTDIFNNSGSPVFIPDGQWAQSNPHTVSGVGAGPGAALVGQCRLTLSNPC